METGGKLHGRPPWGAGFPGVELPRSIPNPRRSPQGMPIQSREMCETGTQAQVDVVGHRMPFHQVDASLTAQLPQDHADLPPQPPVEDLPAVFRYDHDVVLAVPPHMGQVTPLVHRLALQPVGAFPEGEPMPFDDPRHAGSLEALRVTRPEAVAS